MAPDESHDPLCTEQGGYWEPDECPECKAIARVRADERRHIEMAGVIDREVALDDLRARVLDLPRGRDRESGAWCIEVDALLALLEARGVVAPEG